MTYSEAVKRLRLPLGFILAALYLVFARPTPLSLVTGASVALLGVIVRAWAAGHITKNRRLAVTGPYAHTRNPLYFGSFLIGAGFAIAAHWALLLIVIAFWSFVYGPTMQRERENIAGRFPDAYPAYAANVPGFIPRVRPWRSEPSDEGSFDARLYLKHGEWKAGVTYVLVVAWLAARIRFGF